MAKYCDSKELEAHWFNWVIASTTPELDEYRSVGLLYTKIIGTTMAPDGRGPFFDLKHPTRAHCLAITTPVYFQSYKGSLSKPMVFERGASQPTTCQIPKVSDRIPDEKTVLKLITNGYFAETPTAQSWERVFNDVANTCNGISHKFRLTDEHHRQDLAYDALLQIIEKIKTKKLVFTPGLSPVFNLITTSIYRTMYSILNNTTKTKNNLAKYHQQESAKHASKIRRARTTCAT